MLLKEHKMRLLIFLLFILFSSLGYTNNFGIETGLKIPRYVSLKSDESNLRVGPSKNYPIILVYSVTNFPIKIIDEFEDWRKIIDFEDNIGWVHKSLIRAERYGIVVSESEKKVIIFNSIESKIIGEIEKGAIVLISKCKVDKCKIINNDYSGWIKKKYIWGIEQDEKFNINLLQMLVDHFNKSITFIENIFFKY